MRTITIVFVAMMMHIGCTSGKGTFNDFYQENKYNEGVVTFEVPSFLFQYLVRKADVGDETGNELLRKVRGVQVYISEGASRDEITRFERILDPGLYKELMVMRDGPTLLSFKAREGRGGIEEILLTATGDEGLFVLSLTGRFSEEDARTMISHVNLADAFNLGF